MRTCVCLLLRMSVYISVLQVGIQFFFEIFLLIYDYIFFHHTLGFLFQLDARSPTVPYLLFTNEITFFGKSLITWPYLCLVYTLHHIDTCNHIVIIIFIIIIVIIAVIFFVLIYRDIVVIIVFLFCFVFLLLSLKSMKRIIDNIFDILMMTRSLQVIILITSTCCWCACSEVWRFSFFIWFYFSCYFSLYFRFSFLFFITLCLYSFYQICILAF